MGPKVTNSSDQFQPRAHCSLCIVLMRFGIPEIHQHAVAHVFSHKSAKATHGLGNALLISRNDLAQILGVHSRGECRRSDEVREHHRDLPALGSVPRQTGGIRRNSDLVCLKVSNRTQHFAAIAENDAQFLQVVVSQVREDLEINAVFGKALRVLGHAELFEPFCNSLHCGPLRIS